MRPGSKLRGDQHIPFSRVIAARIGEIELDILLLADLGRVDRIVDRTGIRISRRRVLNCEGIGSCLLDVEFVTYPAVSLAAEMSSAGFQLRDSAVGLGDIFKSGALLRNERTDVSGNSLGKRNRSRYSERSHSCEHDRT